MFLKLLERLGRKRIVMDRTSNEPYLERYYLFLKDRGERFPFNVFLHKFLKSDPDDVHDHRRDANQRVRELQTNVQKYEE
mgnify:CR=1 FL=1